MSTYEDETEVIRREEELRVGTTAHEAGKVGVRKVVDHERAATVVGVGTEHADFERHPVAEGDSGEVEVLPDGSISVPVFQEELVIEKRLVVRERVIVRKHTVVEDRLVEADLRRERVEIEADPEVADRVRHEDGRSWGSVSGDDAGAPATIQGGAA
ncbi:MAG TPA: YsnF/AvaK domain-containing protein [Acidimicrobiales bacterium]|nr:YsnF/AvaK domain-containing protein [Acidimicrobiales bacterium]